MPRADRAGGETLNHGAPAPQQPKSCGRWVARRPGDVCSARTEAERRQATYEEIKKYIAQIKQKHGIIERENYNKPKSEKGGQSECPKEKEIAIEEALKYFQMIPSES